MNTDQIKKTSISLKQILLGLFIGLFIAPTIVYAGFYRWVDENGIVHYGDRIPTKYAKIQRDVVNEQGQVVKTLAAEKTEQELAAEAKERDRQAELKHQAAIKAELNRVLLASYANLADIDTARDQKQFQLNKQIELLSVNTENLKQQKQSILNRVKVISAGNSENKEIYLERQNAQLADIQKNLEDIALKQTKLQADIDRLNEFYEKEKRDYALLINE